MLISMVMPTLRPSLAEQTIRRIQASTGPVDFEIVIVSPEPYSGDRIVHVPEREANGPIAAHRLGYAASRGDIIMCVTDDLLPEPDWLVRLEGTIAAQEARTFPFAGGISRPKEPFFGTVYGLYYPYFPVMSRRSVEAIGGWFSDAFYRGWADPDLAMRVWHAGGRCALLPNCCAQSNPDQVRDPEEQTPEAVRNDFPAFYERWHSQYGAGFGTEPWDIGHDYPLGYFTDGSFEERRPHHVARASAGIPPVAPKPAPPPKTPTMGERLSRVFGRR